MRIFLALLLRESFSWSDLSSGLPDLDDKDAVSGAKGVLMQDTATAICK